MFFSVETCFENYALNVASEGLVLHANKQAKYWSG